jgi:hypothetical protein
MTAAVLSLVPAERSGMATSAVNMSRELGGVRSPPAAHSSAELTRYTIRPG